MEDELDRLMGQLKAQVGAKGEEGWPPDPDSNYPTPKALEEAAWMGDPFGRNCRTLTCNGYTVEVRKSGTQWAVRIHPPERPKKLKRTWPYQSFHTWGPYSSKAQAAGFAAFLIEKHMKENPPIDI